MCHVNCWNSKSNSKVDVNLGGKASHDAWKHNYTASLSKNGALWCKLSSAFYCSFNMSFHLPDAWSMHMRRDWHNCSRYREGGSEESDNGAQKDQCLTRAGASKMRYTWHLNVKGTWYPIHRVCVIVWHLWPERRRPPLLSPHFLSTFKKTHNASKRSSG